MLPGVSIVFERGRVWAVLALAVMCLPGCQDPGDRASSAVPGPALEVESLPALPRPVTNNAVAAVPGGDGARLLSFMGLTAGKAWADTTLSAYQLDPGAERWQRIAPVPGNAGRLAGVAAVVGEHVYVFGGYTVAEDHSEQSIPLVHRFDPDAGTYTEVASMPVPAEDAVALVHRDRYVYLVSGWHDTGNVNLVQVYDTRTDTWDQATPWPGPPVFGHAGGIVDGEIVIADGVRIEVDEGGRRFTASSAAYRGTIDPADPSRVEWRAIPPHPGPALYRMAATGTARGGARVVFAGGSDNPYNYDGIGYDGEPSAPSDRVFAYDLEAGAWKTVGRLPFGTMDHRGLLDTPGGLVIAGGMRARQAVSAEVVRFRLPGPANSGR